MQKRIIVRDDVFRLPCVRDWPREFCIDVKWTRRANGRRRCAKSGPGSPVQLVFPVGIRSMGYVSSWLWAACSALSKSVSGCIEAALGDPMAGG
jgi:hypothetical protein